MKRGDVMNAFHKMKVKSVTVTYTAPQNNAPCADSPYVARAILVHEFSRLDTDVESFAIVCLDSGHRVIGFKVLHTGTATTANVDASKLFRVALAVGAHGIIIAHNHPSGNVEPSADDKGITRKLADGARLLGMQLLDSIILTARGESLSLFQTVPELFQA